MSIFERIVHRGRADSDTNTVCMHAELVPMWESVADMGRSDRITRFKCASCSVIFPAAEARALMDRGTARQLYAA